MRELAALSRQTEVLDGLLAEVDSSHRQSLRPMVIFDLDDTLLSTAQRHIRILREFAGLPSVRTGRPEEAWTLAQLEPAQLRYSITDTAEAAGVDDPGVLKELRQFWFARFFQNDYIRGDEAVCGAPEYCRDVLALGGVVVYLTGRDESMREGTLTALSRNGFPMPNERNVILILKPKFEMPDLEFKRSSLMRLAEMGPVAGGFENEPAHVNLLREAFPRSRMVFIDTKHSGRPVSPHPSIPWIRDFLRG